MLVPGFVDLQVNGIDDVDVFCADDNGWNRLGQLLLDQGVTAWCPTLITAPLASYNETLERIVRAQSRTSSQNLPTIVGAHLEGPFLGGRPGAHQRNLIIPADVDWLASLPDIVRLVTIAPETTNAVLAITSLVDRGVVVSLGHSSPGADQTEAAVAAGATMVTHLFNAMSGVDHRRVGLALTALTDDRLAVGLIADLVHTSAQAVQLAFRSKGSSSTVLVTDAVAWRSGRVGVIGLELRDGAPRLVDGTLAGSALTMDQAIRNVVARCGVSVEQAVRSATSNPAAVMGRDDLGQVVAGRRADLVALDANLAITGVWLAGARVR